MLERGDMVDRLFGAGTSSTECSICHEEYASEEDILRILKCGHRYDKVTLLCQLVEDWLIIALQLCCL